MSGKDNVMNVSDNKNDDLENMGNVGNEDATITNAGASGDGVAVGGTTEDTTVEAAKDELIANQKSMIETLIDTTKSLQDQIGVLLRNGATITDGNADDNAAGNTDGNADGNADNKPEDEEYISLSQLGAEMGTRRYENVNSKEV